MRAAQADSSVATRPASGASARCSSVPNRAQPKAFAAAAKASMKAPPAVARAIGSKRAPSACAAPLLAKSKISTATSTPARALKSLALQDRAALALSSIEEVEQLLKGLTPEDLAALAKSTDPAEQVPVRIAMEFVGDKDLSWDNAQISLRNGPAFVKEILGMKGDRFITRRALQRMEGVGSLDLTALEGKCAAAQVLAIYLRACMLKAKERLGINLAPVKAPCREEVPELWPMKVDFREVAARAVEAARWGKTALFICNGHAEEVDTFFTYRGGGCASIDALSILNQVSVAKNKSVDQIRQELARQFEAASTQGKPIHISMSRTALPFRDAYCGPGALPEAVFKNASLKEEAGELMQEGCYSFVTTDFDLQTAREHLSGVLPFFEDMAIVEIDLDSFSG